MEGDRPSCTVPLDSHVVRAKPISINQDLLSILYPSSSESMKVSSHTVEACGIGLMIVKHIVSEGKPNWNKYTTMYNVIIVMTCLSIISNAVFFTAYV
jgi:hypothetical protein